MAFMTYILSDEEKKKILEKYDFRFGGNSDIPAHLHYAIYDAERNTGLFPLSFPCAEVPGISGFVWNETVCCTAYYRRFRTPENELTSIAGYHQEKSTYFYNIRSIYVPQNFDQNEKQLSDWIKEAFDNFILIGNYGNLYFNASVSESIRVYYQNGWTMGIFVH